MKYCSECASTLEYRTPEGDDRPRHLCPECGTVHYVNPRIVAGTLPVFERRILLCRRAIEPRLGYWTLPAGFMENGESMALAALRETREEACAEVELGGLLSVISVPHIDQVHVFFAAQMARPEFAAGPESLEVELFAPAELPWDDLAFPTVRRSLKYFLDTRREDGVPLIHTIKPSERLERSA